MGPATAPYRICTRNLMIKDSQNEPYTVALTSCGRFDLLERTLGSLLPRLDGPLERIIISEDSGDLGIEDVIRNFTGQYGKIDFIVNDPPVGQIRSIDRLYSMIDTEWIFHCEDDWEFFSSGFIEKSFIILKEFSYLSMVSVRDRRDLEENRFYPQPYCFSGIQYYIVNPAVKPTWAGLSFNPGLRRMSDYRIVGPYSKLRVGCNEAQVSDCYRALGYHTAYLGEPATRHIGWEQRTRDRTVPSGPVERLNFSIRKRLERTRWKLAPETDPVLKAKRRMEKAGKSLG